MENMIIKQIHLSNKSIYIQTTSRLSNKIVFFVVRKKKVYIYSKQERARTLNNQTRKLSFFPKFSFVGMTTETESSHLTQSSSPLPPQPQNPVDHLRCNDSSTQGLQNGRIPFKTSTIHSLPCL